MTNAHSESDTPPSLATLSAHHRDLLWVLSQTGPTESLPLKRALTTHYTEHIDHAQFCDVLSNLVDDNLVAKQPSDHHPVEYKLTKHARRALQARRAWQAGVHVTTEGGRN